MQYGLEIFPYKRIKDAESKEKISENLNLYLILRYIVGFLICLLIGRVKLINGMAPFGIAFLVAVTAYTNSKFAILSTIGTAIGYLTLYSTIDNMVIYMIAIATILCLNYVTENFSKKKRAILIFSFIAIEILINNIFIYGLDFKIAFLKVFLELACIVPIYFILDYSILCFKEINTKHIFTNEEIISMGIMVSLVVAGTWGLAIYGISLMNIIGLLAIIIITFTCGSAIGTAAGVAMGIMVGMASPNMVQFISVYGSCALIAGVFREAGKWVSGASCVVAFFIIQIYLGAGNEFKGIEGLVAAGVFLAIPKNIYKRLSLDLNAEEKKVDISENYISKVKYIFTDRLDGFSNLLSSMSNILNNLVDNDKLAMKTKSSALVENLADRVCSNCNMNSICWKRELHYTYSAFSELIENYQAKRHDIPEEIERKCTKRTSLIKSTEEIVNKYIIDEMKRASLCEGREMLANQINNMAHSVKEIIHGVEKDIIINPTVESNVRRILDKNKVEYLEVICLENSRGHIVIKLVFRPCGGKQKCVKEVLPLINEVTEKCMCVSEDKCNIDRDNNICSITFEQAPKYHVTTHVARKCKDGEKDNGDSYIYSKLKDGTYMSIISDGMGSGPQAGRESGAAVDIIKKYTDAGFSKVTAINAVNSIMSMKFSEEEKFSTVDLSSIDLYNGEMQFMKVGAVPSFIKSNDNIDVIKSKTLPIGVLDKVDIEIQNRKVKNGDIIVMVSDGALDYNDDNIGKTNWIINYLKNNNSNDPKEISHGLINEAIKLSGYKVKDDMTILVSKIYNIY